MVHNPGNKIMEQLEKKYNRRVENLDWTKYEPGPLQDELRELNSVVHAHLEGRDYADFRRKTGKFRDAMKVTMADGSVKWDVGRTGSLYTNLDEIIPVRGINSGVTVKPGSYIGLGGDPTEGLKAIHDAMMSATGKSEFTVNLGGRDRTFRMPKKLEVHEKVFERGHGEKILTHDISLEPGAVYMPDVTQPSVQAELRRAGQGLFQVIENTEVQRQWHDRGTYEGWLKDQYGGAAWEYAQGQEKFFRHRAHKMYGIEDSAGVNEGLALRGQRFAVDSNKTVKVFENLSRLKNATEEEALIDPRIRKLVREGKMTSTEFTKYIEDLVQSNLTNRYVPRNDYVEVAPNGSRIDPHSDEAMAARGGSAKDPRNTTSGSLRWKGAPVAHHYDPEDLAALERAVGRGSGLQQEREASEAYAADARREGPTFGTMNIVKKSGRYARETAGNYAMYLAEVPKDIQSIFSEEVNRLNRERATRKGPGKYEAEIKGTYRTGIGEMGAKPLGYTEDILTATPSRTPTGGFNVRDLLDSAMARETPEVTQFMEDYLIPRMSGTPGHSVKSMMSYRALQSSKSMAKWFIDTPAMSWATDPNSCAGRLRESLKQYAETPMSMTDAKAISGGAAGWLYKSHLGLNMMSIVGQMLQTPSFVIPTLGFDAWSHGMKQALKQIDGYAKERVKMPINISAEERKMLRNKHFPLTNVDGRDLLGITDDILDTIDGTAMASRMNAKRRPGMLEWALLEAPLKLFENFEVANRIVTGEAAQFKLRQANLREPISGGKFTRGESLFGPSQFRTNVAGGPVSEADQIEQFVGLINYGATPMNTPFAMASSSNPALGFINLAIPAIRQFLTFPLRSALFPVATSPILGGGTREFGLQRFGGPSMQINATIGDTLRILGTGAVIYTVGKNMMGADLSQQLGGQAIGDLPGKIAQGRIGDMLPPIIDIPVDAMMGVLRFDDEKLGDSLMRVVPAGIALQRFSQMLPELPNLPGIEIQKEYADWTAMREDGTIPIYKGNGTLMEFRSATGTILKGIGMDMGRFKDEREVNSFLIRNRDRMVQMKNDYKNAVMANSMGKAKQIEMAYQKAFGMPLKVQHDEWGNAIEAREKTMMARQIERLPNPFEPQYQQYLQGYSSQMSPFSSGLTAPDEEVPPQ